eukprot:UN0455
MQAWITARGAAIRMPTALAAHLHTYTDQLENEPRLKLAPEEIDNALKCIRKSARWVRPPTSMTVFVQSSESWHCQPNGLMVHSCRGMLFACPMLHGQCHHSKSLETMTSTNCNHKTSISSNRTS